MHRSRCKGHVIFLPSVWPIKTFPGPYIMIVYSNVSFSCKILNIPVYILYSYIHTVHVVAWILVLGIGKMF